MLQEVLQYQNVFKHHIKFGNASNERKGTDENAIIDEFVGCLNRGEFALAREFALFLQSKSMLEKALSSVSSNQFQMIVELVGITDTSEERENFLSTQFSTLLSKAKLRYLIAEGEPIEESGKVSFLALNAVTPVSDGSNSNNYYIRRALLEYSKDNSLTPENRQRAHTKLKMFDSMVFLAQKGYSCEEIERYFEPSLGELNAAKKEAMLQAFIERDKIFACISTLTFLAAADFPAILALKATNSLSDSFRVGLCASGLLLAHAYTSSKGNDVANMLNKALKKYLPEVWKSVKTHYVLAMPTLATLVITDSVMATSAIGLCTAIVVKAPELIAKFAPDVPRKIMREYRMATSELNTHCPEFLKKIPGLAKEHYTLALPAVFTLAVSGSALLTTAVALCVGTYVLTPNLSPGFNINYVEPFKQQCSELAGKVLESVKGNIALIAVPTLITYAVSNSVLSSASACVAAAVLSFASNYLHAKGDVNYKAVIEKLKELTPHENGFVTKLHNMYDKACDSLAVGLS